MPQVKCDICQQLLADKRGLRRHRKSIHKIYPQANSFECNECGFSTKSLYEPAGHMTVQHDAPNPRYCLYCNKCFPRDVDYLEHMNGVHSLPAWNINSENLQHLGILPTERAFGGALKTYEIAVGASDLDLLHNMHIKRQKIENIVRLSVQQHSQKVQFSSKIRGVKKASKTWQWIFIKSARWHLFVRNFKNGIRWFWRSHRQKLPCHGWTDASGVEQLRLTR